MRVFSATALAVALAVAACARTEPGPPRALGPEPTLAGGVFSSGGGLTVAAELREIEGRAAVCGVWSKTRQSVLTRGENRRVIATGSAFVGGDRVVQGLDFLPEVPQAESYAGAPARCVLIDRAWDPALVAEDLTIRLPRQIVVNDSDGEIAGGGGVIVTFRQTAL